MAMVTRTATRVALELGSYVAYTLALIFGWLDGIQPLPHWLRPLDGLLVIGMYPIIWSVFRYLERISQKRARPQ